MANRFANPRPQFMNATPAVYASGILRFYASGTSTPMNVYSGSDLTGASTTITLNSAGRPSQDIFLSNSLYKVTLEDSLGNIIWTVDPYMTSDYTTTAKVTGYSGNPNTHVAGTASAGAVPADMVWDRTNHILYVCTTTGVAAAAVWTVANSTTGLDTWTTAERNVSPVEGVDFGYNTTLHGLEYWNASKWITLGKMPTVQKKTSGSGATFTPTTGAVYFRIRMCGGGGGGGARTANNGAAGTDTTFQVNATGTAWQAVKGSGGVVQAAGGAGGFGGSDGSTGTLIYRMDGQSGGAGSPSATGGVNSIGGFGGSNPISGGATASAVSATTGAFATANSGGGGQGGSAGGVTSSGGGGAGEYLEFWVSGMTTATYTVGSGGAGGAAGTVAGGDGAAGIIIIEEFYS